ncbi:MAG: hypothetical protein RL235_778, partial [Chlamydiota bacterium]
MGFVICRVFLFSALVASLLVPTALKLVTYGFKLEKLHLDLQFQAPQMPELASEEQINQALRQPYFFLGKGAQCYAFESQDHQYVLKLLRFDRNCASGGRGIDGTKVAKVFKAFQLAAEEMPIETGLIYLHLNPATKSLPSVAISGPAWHRHVISLDTVRFILQRKAEPFSMILEHHTKQKIDSL